jgi:putative ATP-binding cassette transporter
MNPFQALRAQLGKLQRLAQPYFLPLENGSSSGSAWQFLLLVLALLAVVVGVTLLLLTGAVTLAGSLVPELRDRFLPGVPQRVAAVWQGPIGVVVMVLMAAGLSGFVACRTRLRQGRWVPWLLMGVITLLILVINGINVGISFIARNVDNTLVAYDRDGFWKAIAIYAFCLVLALPIRALQSYLIPKLGLLWREWLSGRLLSRYLQNRVYYNLNPNDESNEEIDFAHICELYHRAVEYQRTAGTPASGLLSGGHGPGGRRQPQTGGVELSATQARGRLSLWACSYSRQCRINRLLPW